MKKVLGVDVGGVIIASRQGDRDTFFNGNHLEAAASPYVFEGLRKLVDEVFGEQVYIVSKCKPKVQQKTREWLEHHNFYERKQERANLSALVLPVSLSIFQALICPP